MDPRPSVLVLLALACLVPAASAECDENPEGVFHTYPRCENVTQDSPRDCFCPWIQPANELTCPLPDNIP